MKAKWEAEKFLDEVKPRNRDNCSDLENDIQFHRGMVQLTRTNVAQYKRRGNSRIAAGEVSQ